MLLRLSSLLFSIASLPIAAGAAVLDYGASEHESQWTVSGSALECTLRHPIPGYGEALFRKGAGGELQFLIESHERPLGSGRARLLSQPPPWNHRGRVRDLGSVDFTEAGAPFRLPRTQARRLLAELERGMVPTFTFRDWADGRDEVSVRLSAVSVRGPLREFRACAAQVLPFDFDDVRFSRLRFAFSDTHPGSEARQRLDRIARYLSAGGPVRQVVVTGHTDSRGYRRTNHQVGQERAEAVMAYLVERGVDPGLFVVTSAGERQPIASNRTAAGRAENRRVEVELLR